MCTVGSLSRAGADKASIAPPPSRSDASNRILIFNYQTLVPEGAKQWPECYSGNSALWIDAQDFLTVAGCEAGELVNCLDRQLQLLFTRA